LELDEFKKQGGWDSKADKNGAKELDAQTKQLIAKLQNELKQKVELFLILFLNLFYYVNYSLRMY
jgi:hypothetical protein